MATSSPSGNCWRTVIRRRSLVITCVVVLWGLTIEARLIHLQVLRHDALVAFAEAQRSRSIETKPKRGEILDREGRVLAYSVDADTVMAAPREVVDPAVTARQLLLCIFTLEHIAELPSSHGRIDHLPWRCHHRVGINAIGQHPAFPIEDLSAFGLSLDGTRPLRLRERHEGIVTKYLQVYQPGLNRQPPQDHHTGNNQRPPSNNCAPAVTRGRGRCHSYLNLRTVDRWCQWAPPSHNETVRVRREFNPLDYVGVIRGRCHQVQFLCGDLLDSPRRS
jgi:hypothetical protein